MGKSGGRKKKSIANHATTDASHDPAANSTAASAAVPSSSNGDADPPIFLKRAHELKEEGNRFFQSRDYPGALRLYEQALRLLPASHPDRALFHSNRAACFMQMRPVDHDAVAAECSLALRAQPGFPRALLRRARALEALGRPDLALRDAQALLASDPAHPDALDLARRLRVAAGAQPDAHSRPSPAALGASIAGLGPCLPTRPSAPSKKANPSPSPALQPPKTEKPVVPNGPERRPPLQARVAAKPSDASSLKSPNPSYEDNISSSQPTISVTATAAVTRWRPLKLVYGHDIRLAQMQAECAFRELREVVAKRFPSSKSVLIKYKDADGDLVTITSSAELRLAESSVDQPVSETDKGEALRMLRLHIVEVSPEQEPPVPEEEEEKLMEDEVLVKADESLSNSSLGETVSEAIVDDGVVKTSSEEEAPKEKDGKKECSHPECKEMEVDDWLFEFAQLFRTQVGIDPDAHLDLHELGMELCSEALEETVTSNEAQDLFEMAAAKFQEVAALAFFNWGNVHMCAARKRIPLDESSPKEVLAAQLQNAYDWVRERYALAGQKYEEALRIKPDFYEGLLALGQQHFETAKLHWSFALANKVDLATWDPSETSALFDSAEEKMKAATKMWEKVEEQRTMELKDPAASKKDEVMKKRRKQAVGAEGQQELTADEAAEQAAVMRSQIHLFWGNMLFERSQVEFKLGMGDWKKKVDAAVERFKLAGASEADISTVLKNHASNVDGKDGVEKKDTNVGANDSEANAKDEIKHVLDD